MMIVQIMLMAVTSASFCTRRKSVSPMCYSKRRRELMDQLFCLTIQRMLGRHCATPDTDKSGSSTG